MPVIVDAGVSVTAAQTGDPEAFVWDRFEYRVVGQPQALFTSGPGETPELTHGPPST